MFARILLIGLATVLATGAHGQSNESITEAASVVATTTPRPMTIEDFVVINLQQYASLSRVLQIKGRFGTNGLWLIDKNGTDYLLLRKSQEEEKKDWEEAAKNANGSDVVCVDGQCLDQETVKNKVEALEASIQQTLGPQSVPGFAVMVSIFILIGLLGIIGNALILSAVLRSKAVRNSTNVLLSSLAASDIIVLALCLPMQVIQQFFGWKNLFSKDVCRLLFFVRYFSVAISVLSMAVMAVERYIAVCHPLKAKSYCTVKNARRLVVLVWILSAGVCVPVAFLINDDPTDLRCFLLLGTKEFIVAFYGALAAVVLIIPLCVMLPLYLKIFQVLWKSTRDAEKLNGSTVTEKEQKETQQTRARKQVIRMLVMVLVLFIVCWAPAVLYDLARSVVDLLSATTRRNSITSVSIGLHSLGICNSFINPLIYTLMSRQYHLYLKSLCGCKSPKEKKTSGASSDGTLSSKATDQEAL